MIDSTDLTGFNMNLTEDCINKTAIYYGINVDDIKRISDNSNSSIMFYNKLEELINER